MVTGEGWPTRLGHRLKNFIPSEFDKAGKEIVGVVALTMRLQRLDALGKTDAGLLHFKDLEPLQMFKAFLDDNDKAMLASLVDLVVKTHSTVDLGSAAGPRKKISKKSAAPQPDTNNAGDDDGDGLFD